MDPKALFEGRFGIYQETNAHATDVVLIFADIPWLHRYFTERTWHSNQVFEQLPDGRLKITFRVGSMIEVLPWIRSFGNDVEVIAPQSSSSVFNSSSKAALSVFQFALASVA